MNPLNPLRQLPSLALRAAARFPVVILAGIFLAAVVVADVHGTLAERLTITSVLSVSLALAASLLGERAGLNPPVRALLALAITAATLWLFWDSMVLVPNPNVEDAAYRNQIGDDTPFRFAALAVAFHALVAVIPWISRSIDRFWEFNRRLLLRILASLFFTGVLYGGLALALWAMDDLLGVDLPDDAYGDLFGIMIGVVNTWFFLVGVPEISSDIGVAHVPERSSIPESTDGAFLPPDVRATSYPRSLRVFAQFVLIPLISIYVIILYSYLAKILVEWNLPKGQVSWLVFSYAALGLLAYLLVYPLRDDPSNRWIRTFARGFFVSLPALVALLATAILRRTSDYGMTELRVLGLVLAGWLAVITVWFLIRREDIRIVPATLAIVAILSVVGPWNASAVSVRSQTERLEKLMAARNRGSGPVSDSADGGLSIGSIAEYLRDRGAFSRAALLVSNRPDTVSSVDEFMQLAGFEGWWDRARALPAGDQPVGGINVEFQIAEPIDVAGFTSMLRVDEATNDTAGSAHVRWSGQDRRLHINTPRHSLTLELDSILTEMVRRRPAFRPDKPAPRPPAPMIDRRSDGLRARLILLQIGGEARGTSTAIFVFRGLLFISTEDSTARAQIQ